VDADNEKLTEEFTVRITPSLKVRLTEVARRELRRPADMVRVLIVEALANREQEQQGRKP